MRPSKSMIRTRVGQINQALFRNFATSSRKQRNLPATLDPKKLDDEIVISGISGRFPQSNSMEEFKINLLGGRDLLMPQTRFNVGKKLPPRFGFINNLANFDAEFFGVSDRLTQPMDPALRILLEVTYEAIVDAGINPTSLRGSNTGVYVACDGADGMTYWKMKHGFSPYDGYIVLGTMPHMQANQVSHLFDFNGTSMSLSTVCSGSLFALETAVIAMRSGTVDRAIVGATCLHLISNLSDDLNILGALSPTGYCKPFDKDGNGFVRSEAVVSILLEKKSAARRNYATVRHILTKSDGIKKEGIFCPVGRKQEELYRKVCTEANIDPAQVFYVEAHGTGTQAGDPQELRGLANFYGKAPNRTRPFLVGSVKSNMGHAEAASGLVSIAKLLASAQDGVIPPTIHFNTPNELASEFFVNEIKVVTEKTWICTGRLFGVSAFGIGGTIAHVILELNSSPKHTKSTNPEADQSLPVIVELSGRTEKSLEQNLGKALNLASNPEYRSLLHYVFQERIPGHDYRGFGVIPLGHNNKEAEKDPVTFTANVDSNKNRPLWFVFSGLGSQWSGIGKELLRIDSFHESVQRSKVTLKNAGVDLDRLLELSNQSIFENIRDAMNSISVMQVALYDTLMSLGLRPIGYFGYSFGEIMCAYADGFVTAEEALLLVDARGRAVLDATLTHNLEPGAMAAVGLPMSDLKLRCPPKVTPACHNGPNDVTVSGSKGAVADFVGQLQAEGIFAREIDSCQVASHSPWIQPAAEVYLKHMQDIYKGQGQLLRSRRWVSTSELNDPSVQVWLPEYFANNLVSPVLFYEAVAHVPANAVVVEIAPTGVLYRILRSSLPDTSLLVSPMQAEVQDGLLSFFTSLGNMYNAGVDMNLAALYPPVPFPVGASTPSLNSLMGWKHDTNWIVPLIENSAKYMNGVLNVDMNESSFHYLEGHKLDDRFVFPATGYLVFAWQTLASTLGCDYQELPVAFENIFFERATFLSHDKPCQLRCCIQEGTGSFEIHEKGTTVAKGTITSQPQLKGKRYVDVKWKATKTSDRKNGLILDSADLYKELGIRGYNFKGEFRSVKNVDIEGQRRVVTWRGNWTSFLDSFLQACSIITPESTIRPLCVPVRLQAATINPQELLNFLKTSDTDDVPILHRGHVQKSLAPGIVFHKMRTVVIQRKSQKGIVCVSEYRFSPYMDIVDPEIISALPSDTSLENQSLASLVDIVLENFLQKQVQVYDIVTSGPHWTGPYLSSYLSAQPKHEVYLTTMSTETEIAKIRKEFKENAAAGNSDFVSKLSASDLIPERGIVDLVIVDDSNMIKAIGETMRDGSYIILRDLTNGGANSVQTDFCIAEAGLQKVAQKSSKQFSCSLLKKVPSSPILSIQDVFINSKSNFDWLPALQSILAIPKDSSRIYLCSQNDLTNGVVGLAKCLAREPGCGHIRCIFDPEGKLTLNFDQPDRILSDIIKNDMLINVYQDDCLGAFRHVKLRSPVLNEPTKPVTHAFVNTLSVGNLSSLNWIESPLNVIPDHEHLFKVNYASLNFRDLMMSTGKLPLTPVDLETYRDDIGMEYTGICTNGRRVMVISSNSSLATAVRLKPDEVIVWDVPANWTQEDAATVPIAYATAYYSLLMSAGMQPWQSILIHSGTGGVGQAAINIARSMNCDIFTTVGTPEKRNILKRLFPSIPDDHVGNSRDCTFEDQFLEVTQGKGVDFVLNSLADDKLFASLRCLAARGTFVEIGKFDIYKDTPMGMNHIQQNVVVMAVDLLPILSGVLPGKAEVVHLFEQGLKSGVVKPLERTVFKQHQVEEAFRYMARGMHVGKVLISVNEEENSTDFHQKSRTSTLTKIRRNNTAISSYIMAVPRSYFHPKKAYVILGGLGGFGLELADWLITRCAKHVVLLSRSGITNGYQILCIKRWSSAGVTVETNKSDLGCLSNAKKFMEVYKSRGIEIGGIFNSSLVLRDALIDNQTKEMFQAVASPKVKMTQNLDLLSREYYPDMDYFVCFSSISAGLGIAGQSNYGWANSCMENICKCRSEAGFHGAAVQWGVVGDVGYVAEKIGVEKIEGGFLPQRISSCIQALDTILEHSKGNPEHSKCYASYVVSGNILRGQRAVKVGLLELMARLGLTININDESMQSKTMAELGLDSLSGIELQQRLEIDYDVALPVSHIRNLQWQDLQAIADGTFLNNKPNQIIKEEGYIQDQGPYINLFTSSDQIDEVERTVVQLREVIGEVEKEKAADLFLVPGADGKACRFLSMANKLKCNVYAFQNKGFGKATYYSIKKMADAYIQELKAVQHSGPYNLGGYSFGATLAFEMAQQLTSKHSEKVGNLVLLDGFFSMTKAVRQTNEFFINAMQYLLKYSDKEKKTYLELLEKTEPDQMQPFVQKILKTHLKSQAEELRNSVDVIIASRTLFFGYDPSPDLHLDANVFLIKAKDSFFQAFSECPDYHFQKFCSQPIFLYNVSGNHDSFLEDPFVQQAADIVNNILLGSKTV